jgi:hypothetical protein
VGAEGPKVRVVFRVSLEHYKTLNWFPWVHKRSQRFPLQDEKREWEHMQ